MIVSNCRKKRRSQKPVRRLERGVWVAFPSDVGLIATSRSARAYVKEHAWCGDWERRGQDAFARSRRGNPKRRGTVLATIAIDAYLTTLVPEKLRTRTFAVKTFGEVLVHAALMYAKVYAADERLGGESVPTRNARLKRQKKPLPMCLNRGFGPYIYGHDIGDLAFEQAFIKWDGKNKCSVRFGIGS